MNFVTPHGVLECTALTRSTMYRLMKAGSFPAKVSMGGHAIAWDKYEVEIWMEQCINGEVNRTNQRQQTKVRQRSYRGYDPDNINKTLTVKRDKHVSIQSSRGYAEG